MLSLLAATALAQADLGFEHVDRWLMNGPGTSTAADADAPHGGEHALRVTRTDHHEFAASATIVMVEPEYVGQDLTITGWVRTDGVRRGYAGWWLRVDSATDMLAIENTRKGGLRGTRGWTPVTATVPLPDGAERVLIGPLFTGRGVAWFDDLEIRVGDEVLPELSVVATTAIQSPVPWTDEERRTAEDPRAPAVPDAWIAEARARAVPLHSLVSDDFTDLAGVGAAIGPARVVALGESSHGVSEYNHAKVRLIQYLHQELGFSVLAVESGLWECTEAAGHVGAEPPERTLRRCLFRVWDTAEVEALFAYLAEVADTDHPLQLTGFDVQSSSKDGQVERVAFLRDTFAPADTDRADAIAALDQELGARIDDAGRTWPIDLADVLDRLDDHIAWADAHADAAITGGADADDVAFARQLLRSRRAFADQMSRDGVAMSTTRDAGMADNLQWLLGERFPDERVIVWAHNGHVRHTAAEDGPTPLGLHMKQALGDELYTVGLYGYRGATALNNGEVIPVQRARPDGLEALLYRMREAAVFVDLRDPPEGPAGAWITTTIPTLSWGMTIEPLVPGEAYDGILFIDTLSPPTYLPRDP